MLQAKTSQGLLVTLAVLTNKEILRHKKYNQFYCPACKERVIIKAGTKVIPHFAHQSKVNCPSYKGGEGPYHESGKLLLYQWLKSQNLSVQLEVFISEINQRPDILLELNNKRIAIEFQCARINIKEIRQRNEGYKKARIIPIWILGANCFRRQTKTHFKLDQFTLQFIHQFSSEYPSTLFCFCPKTLNFIKIQHVYVTKTGQAIGDIQISQLNKLEFKDIFLIQPFSINRLYELWKNEKRYFRLRPRKQAYGKSLAWYTWLYMKGTHLEYLPSVIHLPVSNQYQMKTPAWDWQSRLCLEVLYPLQIGNHFSINLCTILLKEHIYYKSYFPLIKSAVNPINQYLDLLEQLQIIKRSSVSHFTKINPLTFYNNIEGSLKGDTAIMNKLLMSSTNKIEA